MSYRCTIKYKDKQIAEARFIILSANDENNNKRAIELMDKFLNLIAKNLLINTNDCSTNLYREEWVEGI